MTWSAQNIDRTVTSYRACKRADRTLVLDLYTIDVRWSVSPHFGTACLDLGGPTCARSSRRA